MRAAGFEIERSEGIVVPARLIFGNSIALRIALAMNAALVRLRPTLFGFQILLVAKARPTLATLLDAAKAAANQKAAEVQPLHMQRSA
jgi:hypothetical protein